MAAQDDKSPGNEEGSLLHTVTTDNATPQPFRFIAIHNATATAGFVALTDAAGFDDVVYLTAGQVLVCRPIIIKTTGTTVTKIIGYKR
jgi:hypothetical protein